MEIVKFDEVVKRANAKEDRFNTNKIYYVGGDHIESNELMVHERGIIKGSTIGPMFYCGFKAGDILFVTRNPHLRKCSMVDFEGICSEKTFVLETKDSTRLLQEYLALVMQSDDFWLYCDENKSGGVNFFVNWSTLADYEFALPPLDEQKALADKLWAAYRVKESYRQLLAATDDMVKAKFVEEYGSLDKESLSPYIEIVRGVSYKPSDVREENDGEATTILRANNISNTGLLNFDDLVFVDSARVKEEQSLRAGDIIMCASSGSPEHVGKVALVNKDYANTAFGAFCMVIRSKNGMSPEYLFCLLHSNAFRQHIERICNGTNILNIKQEYVKEWECPVAPEQAQQTIKDIFIQAEATKASLRESIESIDGVIRSLINQ